MCVCVCVCVCTCTCMCACVLLFVCSPGPVVCDSLYIDDRNWNVLCVSVWLS